MRRSEQKRRIKSFLNHFSYGTEKLLCYSIDNDRSNSRMKTTTSLDEVLDNNDKVNSDAYFYVNNGGTKQFQISKLVACFIDIDAGRDKNGKYFTPAVVAKKKTAMQKAIKAFRPSPNLIVETRNGYHLYWLINQLDGLNLNNQRIWKNVQNKLHNAFVSVGSDSKVGKINQIMRLPNTKWCKEWARKKEKFNVTLKVNHLIRFNLEELNSDIDKFNNGVSHVKTKSSPGGSWSRPTIVDISRERNTSSYDRTNSFNDSNNIIGETIDFLNELAPQLKFKGLTFSYKTALKLANELHKVIQTR